MASSSARRVHEALQNSNAKYMDSSKKDILAAISQFSDLSPGTDWYRFPDGKRKNAFRLKGTVPINYKGTTYNIPVILYLWDSHPYYPPICYVNPTENMAIKESEHVNSEGRLFLPYLKEWRFPGYDLNGLIQVMIMVFQEKCPVFAKSSSTTSASSTTPYPSTNTVIPTPYSSTSSNLPYPTSGYNPYMNVGPNNTPYPVGSSNFPLPTPPPRPIPPTPQTSTSSVEKNTLKASLCSAIEGKIKSKLSSKLDMYDAEMSSIQETASQLRSGQQKLKNIVNELDAQKKNLSSTVDHLMAKKLELERALNDAGGTEAPQIDDAIDASKPLYRQIVQNYAKDLTCDDVIYALGQSLKRNKITLSEYLRRVRDVSREQFICRATVQKCRRVAGLPV